MSISQDQVINELKMFYEEHGFVPSIPKCSQHLPFSGTTVRKLFGKWNTALELAGVPFNDNTRRIKVSCGYCGEELSVVPSVLDNKSGLAFCNRSCAAKYNNKHIPKKEKKIRVCKSCGQEFT